MHHEVEHFLGVSTGDSTVILYERLSLLGSTYDLLEKSHHFSFAWSLTSVVFHEEI